MKSWQGGILIILGVIIGIPILFFLGVVLNEIHLYVISPSLSILFTGPLFYNIILEFIVFLLSLIVIFRLTQNWKKPLWLKGGFIGFCVSISLLIYKLIIILIFTPKEHWGWIVLFALGAPFFVIKYTLFFGLFFWLYRAIKHPLKN